MSFCNCVFTISYFFSFGFKSIIKSFIVVISKYVTVIESLEIFNFFEVPRAEDLEIFLGIINNFI